MSEALSKNKMVVKQRKNLLVENVVDPASGEVLEEFRLPPWWPKRLRPPRRLASRASRLSLRGRFVDGLLAAEERLRLLGRRGAHGLLVERRYVLLRPHKMAGQHYEPPSSIVIGCD